MKNFKKKVDTWFIGYYIHNFIYFHSLSFFFNTIIIAFFWYAPFNQFVKNYLNPNNDELIEAKIYSICFVIFIIPFVLGGQGYYFIKKYNKFYEIKSPINSINDLDFLHRILISFISKNKEYVVLITYIILYPIGITWIYSQISIEILNVGNTEYPYLYKFLSSFVIVMFWLTTLEQLSGALRYLPDKLLIIEDIKIEESLTPHQSKEENLYEELRTRFAFHNITKDVRNLKSYITILKHEEPQLLTKFNTLDELTDMVEDTLSKFKNSDTIRTKNPFLVHELFDNFLILNKPDLVREGSDLQIEYQKLEYKDLEIHQIFYEVYQVLNNLIDNARKAIAHSNRKEIQILTLVSKEGFVDFRVSDTGVGIDTKARNRVFDIGYSTTNGDGLGLLFVQTTLKRFGGEIQLLPTAISGFSTTFEVRIPTQKG